MGKLKQEEQVSEDVVEVVEEVEDMEIPEPEYFCNMMVCSKCNCEKKVRKDVYIERMKKAAIKGIDEKEMNRNYLCSNCRNGRSIKKDEFYTMLKSED